MGAGQLPNTKRVVIIGGTGNGMVTAQVVMDMQRNGADITVYGFLNDHLSPGDTSLGWPVLGSPDAWQQLPDDVGFVFALLTVNKMEERVERLTDLDIPQERLVTLVHPTAILGFDSQIGAGTVICSHVTVQPKAKLGRNLVVRAGANIGHDVTIADYVDIGPNVTVCGYAAIARGTQVAANAVIKDGLSVGEFAVVGAGTVLLRDADQRSTWMGNPARRVS